MEKETFYLYDFYEISKLLDDDLLTEFFNALYTMQCYPNDYNGMKVDEAFHNLWTDFQKNDENVWDMEPYERWKLVYRVAIAINEIYDKDTQVKYIVTLSEQYTQ